MKTFDPYIEDQLPSDEEMALLDRYTTDQMSAEERDGFDERMMNDLDFFDRLAPMLVALHSPPASVHAAGERAKAREAATSIRPLSFRPHMPRWKRYLTIAVGSAAFGQAIAASALMTISQRQPVLSSDPFVLSLNHLEPHEMTARIAAAMAGGGTSPILHPSSLEVVAEVPSVATDPVMERAVEKMVAELPAQPQLADQQRLSTEIERMPWKDVDVTDTPAEQRLRHPDGGIKANALKGIGSVVGVVAVVITLHFTRK